ncbi:MAG TPA: hypothetical protein VHZ95_15600, partial [Polyangiales bacterium]|nr:hypothetical protein [Polyangiales bacterium]
MSLLFSTWACSAKPSAIEGAAGGTAGASTGSVAGSSAGSSAANSGKSSNSAGSGGNEFGNGTSGPLPMAQDTTGDPISSACVGQTQGAQEVQVDMYIMLDRSGSMLDTTGAGPTKWDAIRQALTSFVQDPQSSGLGVGLQYFPLGVAGVPETCSVDKDCGSGGVCSAKACLPPLIGRSSTFTQCLTAADCPLNSQGCAQFGLCSGDMTLACFSIGAGGCDAQGDCEPYAGECTNYGSCTISDYAAPAVAIAALPGNSDALVTSLTAEKPTGLTPTPAALSGALNLASSQATQHPDRRV